MSVNYKLMKLVPFDYAGNENNKQTGEEKRNREREEILQAENIGNLEKINKYNENLRRFRLRLSDKEKENMSSDDETDNFDFLTKLQKSAAITILNRLKRHPDKIKADPNTGELILNNSNKLNGSNIYELIGDLVKGSKSGNLPLFGQEFLKIFAELNIPIMFIKNKSRRNLVQSMRSSHQSNGTMMDDGFAVIDPPETPARKTSTSKVALPKPIFPRRQRALVKGGSGYKYPRQSSPSKKKVHVKTKKFVGFLPEDKENFNL